MFDIMNVEDRLEVREMLLDILSGPLEKINGQYRLVSNQLSNIEIQTTKTNGNVLSLDTRLLIMEKKVDKELPHTIVTCPHSESIGELQVDVDRLKNGKIVETKLREKLQNHIGLILVAIGVVVTLIVGLVNMNKYAEQMANEIMIKEKLHIGDTTVIKNK